MTYKPQPINTDGVALSDDLLQLTELLAENTHEIWSQQRISEDWSYGPKRDDNAKTHPGLVPYSELTEGEKQYDRNTALETLKLIVKLGYTIVPPAK